MDFSEAQLDWLVAHFVHPGRAWIKPPPLEQSLLDLSLIKAETFPYEDGFDVIVLSLTRIGWTVAVLYRHEDVKKHYGKFGEGFIKMAQMAGVSLQQLPELLSSDEELTRVIASIKLGKLLEDRKDV